eukprot:Plantae.Rhodophyta-Purpureofilum_apyrenoidigerum.ctg11511.p1 GENE.Plantae.Rhodophyta-Purpureofilum_apyrenoidigerum.ctg11511~~Plantae.Rhodophyta-Purpureofilum_apyrenoidigerum.ctg11511.p1  ORF type:complete len:533 (+),score=68.38 Plantae.Rhodophyta-Purpureofilum_apyrenoidigerum.ctg11511:247-1845(+)
MAILGRVGADALQTSARSVSVVATRWTNITLSRSYATEGRPRRGVVLKAHDSAKALPWSSEQIPTNGALFRLAWRATSSEKLLFRNVLGAFADEQSLLNVYQRLRKYTNIVSDYGLHLPLRFDLHDISRRVSNGIYRFNYKQPPPPKRRLRWGELRRLDPTPRLPNADETVLEAVGFGLQVLFNSTWHSSQHGYRGDRSCHTAIQSFRHARGATHLLTINLKRCFGRMDMNVLLDQLRRRVVDPNLETLIIDAFAKGHITYKDETETLNDVPRANALGAVLSNIYFSKLDDCVNDLRAKLRKFTGCSIVEDPSTSHRKMTRDLWYVRYANRLLFSIRASRDDVYWLQDNLNTFFREELRMSMDVKEMILEDAEIGVTFLGAHLYVDRKDGALITRHDAPIPYIIRRLASFGICNLDGEPIPKSRWQHHDKEFILALYNTVLTRIVRYYSFADNYSGLVHRIQYIIKHSCAKLLAKKYGLRTRGGIFLRLGNDLGKGEEFGLALREDLRRENIRDRDLWQGTDFFKNRTRWWV